MQQGRSAYRAGAEHLAAWVVAEARVHPGGGGPQEPGAAVVVGRHRLWAAVVVGHHRR